MGSVCELWHVLGSGHVKDVQLSFSRIPISLGFEFCLTSGRGVWFCACFGVQLLVCSEPASGCLPASFLPCVVAHTFGLLSYSCLRTGIWCCLSNILVFGLLIHMCASLLYALDWPCFFLPGGSSLGLAGLPSPTYVTCTPLQWWLAKNIFWRTEKSIFIWNV